MTNEELVQKIQAGEDVQRNMELLYTQNRSFIYKCAAPFAKKTELDDLMQEAYFGLVKAVDSFDPDKGVLFLTYAGHTITAHLRLFALNHIDLKRIPIPMQERISKYRKLTEAYYAEYGKNPPDALIMYHLSITAKQLQELRRAIRESKYIGLDEPVPGADDVTISDVIADKYDLESDVVHRLAEKQVNADIWQCVNELDPKLRDIVMMRYKDNMQPKTIADQYGVTRQRICQHTRKALRLLSRKEAIKNAAEFYGVHRRPAYRGSLGFFRRHGMSSTEYIAIRELEWLLAESSKTVPIATFATP